MKLGFIGIGKIAEAVIEGWCSSDRKDLSIFLSPRNEMNARRLADKYPNVLRMGTNQEVLDQSDTVCIALRPAVAKEVLSGLRFDKRHTVVSFIPLLRYADLAAAVLPAIKITRAIPLPTVVHHNCPIPLYRSDEQVTELFSAIGQPLQVDEEEQLHAIWTLTGLITPFYELLGGLSDWTIRHGVKKEIADRYVANLFQSLAFAAQQSEPIDFAELASHAATPNGMNEQAGKEIREKGAHEAYRAASDNLLRRFG